ncbi:hypothetical protein D3C73_1433250 [compost metagenome]
MEMAADNGQRGAQIMGNVRDQSPTQPLFLRLARTAGRQLRDHVIESFLKAADLINFAPDYRRGNAGASGEAHGCLQAQKPLADSSEEQP